MVYNEQALETQVPFPEHVLESNHNTFKLVCWNVTSLVKDFQMNLCTIVYKWQLNIYVMLLYVTGFAKRGHPHIQFHEIRGL